MGLLAGFVFAPDRRGLLAALAIAVSVGYALLAGAATGGLADAQRVLAEDVRNPGFVVAQPDLEPFDASRLLPGANATLAVHQALGRTFYTLRDPSPSPTGVQAGPASGLRDGQSLILGRFNHTVRVRPIPPGAAPSWLGVDADTFASIGGPPAPTLRIAQYQTLPDEARRELERRGFVVHAAPAALPFFVEGAQDIVDGVAVTIFASTLVVALTTNSFVAMEIRARRQSLATYGLYAGPLRTQALVLGRGLFLIALGHALGILGTTGALLFLTRGAAATFELEPAWAGLTVGATATGALLGLLPALLGARRRLRAADLAGASPPSRRPRILRPALAAWRNAIPLTVSALVLAASLGVVLGGATIPTQIFGTGNTDVIADRDGNPLRGAMPAFLGAHLHRLEDFEASSPEIFAPTLVKGLPVMVRGVDWPRLGELDPVRVEAGRLPTEPGEAAAGTRLQRLANLRVGETLLLPASYTPTLVRVRVVGVVDVPGILADELFVTLPTARDLTNLATEHVTLIRLRAAAQDGPGAQARPPVPSGLEVVDPRLNPAVPVPNEAVTLTVDVLNFGGAPGVRRLTAHANGQPVADAWIQLGPHETTVATFTFRAPAQGLRSVTVNPTYEPPVEPPAYRILAPSRVVIGNVLEVQVRTFDDRPVSGVRVRLDGRESITDSTGRAYLDPTENGNRTLRAEGRDGRAARPVLVLRPEDVGQGRLVVEALQGPPAAEPGPWSGVAVVENVGGETFEGPLNLVVDGRPTPTTNLRLSSGLRQRVPFTLDFDNGTHTIEADRQRLRTLVAPNQTTAESSLTLDQLIEKRRQMQQNVVENRQDASTAFLGDTYKNLNAALVVVVLVTVLHAGLIALVAVQRETEERAETIGTLAALGADPPALRRRAFLDLAPIAAAAAIVGTTAGLGGAWAAAQLGYLNGFGHALLPRLELEFAARLVAVAIGTALASAAIAIHIVRGRTESVLQVQGPRRVERPPLEELLGGPRP